MQNNQAGEVALTWADNSIVSLLAAVAQQQDVVKDISTDAIRATTSKLDSASEEYLAGLNILTNRAEANTSAVLVEVYDDVDFAAFTAIRHANLVRAEADDEADEEVFVAERRTSAVLIEINLELDRAVEQLKKDNESFLSGVASWFGERFSDLDNLLSPLTDLVSDGIAWLFALPAQLLFDLFKSFFFEETE